MDFLMELLLELLVDGGIEIASNRKFPKSIRWLIIILIILFYAIIIFGLIILGIILMNKNIYVGWLLILIGLLLLYFAIKKFNQLCNGKNNK